MRLGQLLVARGVVAQEAIEVALQRQRRQGGRLGRHLIDLGVLTIEQLASALQEQRSLETAVDACARSLQACRLRHGDIDPETIRARHDLARAYLAAGYAADALSLAEHALTRYREAFGAGHAHTRETAEFIADARDSLDRAASAATAVPA